MYLDVLQVKFLMINNTVLEIRMVIMFMMLIRLAVCDSCANLGDGSKLISDGKKFMRLMVLTHIESVSVGRKVGTTSMTKTT